MFTTKMLSENKNGHKKQVNGLFELKKKIITKAMKGKRHIEKGGSILKSLLYKSVL